MKNKVAKFHFNLSSIITPRNFVDVTREITLLIVARTVDSVPLCM